VLLIVLCVGDSSIRAHDGIISGGREGRGGGNIRGSLADALGGANNSLTAQVLAQLEKQRQRRLDKIAEEREKLLETIKSQQERVEYLDSWSRGRTDRMTARPMIRGKDSKHLESIWDRRQMLLSRLTHFREESHPVIVNGKALNALLVTCGPLAVARQRDQKTLANGNNLSELPAKARQLISDVSDAHIPKSVVDQIQYRQGLGQFKQTGKLGQPTALDLDWPLILRKPVFQVLREDIERYRDEAVSQLKSGQPISPRTAARLMSTVDQLRARVYTQGTRVIQTRNDYRSYFPYKQAEQHLDALAHGVVRFISATKIEHVQLEPFTGKTIEELMAYMQLNSIQFGPAGPNADLAYGQVFDIMLTYFINTTLLQQIASHERGELDVLHARDQHLQNVSDSLATKDGDVLLPLLMHTAEVFFRRDNGG
jgi:hypothetical protein